MDEENLYSPSKGFSQTVQGAPEWLQGFLREQSGSQRGTYYDPSDVLNAYQPQISSFSQRYGSRFNTPAFLGAGKDVMSGYNPFDAIESGNVGDFDWSFDPFGGLSGVGEGLDYLGHYLTHGDAAMKNAESGASAGDQAFFRRYGAYGQDPNNLNYGSGSALYGEDMGSRMKQALGAARGEYDQLQALQSKYGGY